MALLARHQPESTGGVRALSSSVVHISLSGAYVDMQEVHTRGFSGESSHNPGTMLTQHTLQGPYPPQEERPKSLQQREPGSLLPVLAPFSSLETWILFIRSHCRLHSVSSLIHGARLVPESKVVSHFACFRTANGAVVLTSVLPSSPLARPPS